MTKNIGAVDRTLRIGGGLALSALAAVDMVGAWAWIGIVPVATGLLNWCPAYSLLGINTCETD